MDAERKNITNIEFNISLVTNNETESQSAIRSCENRIKNGSDENASTYCLYVKKEDDKQISQLQREWFNLVVLIVAIICQIYHVGFINCKSNENCYFLTEQGGMVIIVVLGLVSYMIILRMIDIGKCRKGMVLSSINHSSAVATLIASFGIPLVEASIGEESCCKTVCLLGVIVAEISLILYFAKKRYDYISDLEKRRV